MECVTQCSLFIDGAEETNFKEVTEEEVTRAKQVALMRKTADATLIPRYAVTVLYVVPNTGARDWSKVKGTTLVIVYDSGEKRTYRGVRVASEGARKADGENEMTQEIKLIAQDRDPK
jgi:hypothetical protein